VMATLWRDCVIVLILVFRIRYPVYESNAFDPWYYCSLLTLVSGESCQAGDNFNICI